MAKQRKLKLTEVIDSEHFKRLSEHQQAFVVRYISRGGTDALEAVKFAYKVKSENAMSLKGQVLRSPKIQRVLNLWLGRNEMDVLAAKIEPLLDIAIERDKKRKRISTSTERAISLIASHVKSKSKHFDDADYPDIESATEAGVIQAVIGKVFVQGGKKYRVVAEEIK